MTVIAAPEIARPRPAFSGAGLLRALSWVLLPWWAAQVFSGEKSFDLNPIIGSHALNRRGLHVWRGRLAQRLTQARRRQLADLVSAQDRDAIDRDGVVVRRNFLPPELFADLSAEARALTALGREFKEGDSVTRRIPLTRDLLRRLPAFSALLAHPEWRGLLRYAAGFDSEPMVFLETIFTHVDDAEPDPQTSLHMDTFHPSMKAWLYLEDVAADDGPFTYAPGSHLRNPRRDAWERALSVRATDRRSGKKGGSFRATKPEIKRMGYAMPKRFAVPANTLIVGDTYGFHRRSPSTRPSVRLEIWAYCRRNPFTPWARSGPTRPGQAVRQALLGWKVLDLRRRLGLGARNSRGVLTDARTPPKPWT